jgi:DnaJ-class molecular chaperone
MTLVWPAIILILGGIYYMRRFQRKRRGSTSQSRPLANHHYVACPECNGEGKRVYSEKKGRVDCHRCSGNGGWQEPDADPVASPGD